VAECQIAKGGPFLLSAERLAKAKNTGDRRSVDELTQKLQETRQRVRNLTVIGLRPCDRICTRTSGRG
jgi:hypothetical protein